MLAKKFGGTAFVATISCSIAVGAGSAPEPLTPAKALSSIRAGDLHFSPDGKELAYVELSYAWDARQRVHVIDLSTGENRELTPPDKTERAPQWSPSGMSLAYLSNRGGNVQIYLAAANGANGSPLTSRKAGVERFRWSPDGTQIAYLAASDDAPSPDGPQVADDPRALPRLWVMDVASRTTRSFGVSSSRIDDFQWQDTGHVILALTSNPRLKSGSDALCRISVSDGGTTPLANPPQPFDTLTLSPDGAQAAIRSTLSGPVTRDLFLGSIQGGSFNAVWQKPNFAILQLRWRDSDGMYARVADGFYNRLYRLPVGRAPEPISLPLSVNSFDVAPNGDIAFVGEDFDHLPEVFIKPRHGKLRQLTHMQRSFVGIRLAPTSIFWTKSFDGTPIEAALVKASDAPAGRKVPLVILVHGGPASNFTAGYSWEAAWAQMLATHGYQVLMVNPRGSNGYSAAFLEANRADWGGGDYKDLLAVLDAVVAKGDVDPERIGIGGWSYGGEMAAWAITQTKRFKAAVAGAPVYDQQAEYETEADEDGDDWWFGRPWERQDVYARNSPATYIRHATTPTLILDGEDDQSNPVGQSRGLYRALKHLNVETALVTYPGEGHSPRIGSNNIDMFERILAWYDRYLKDEAAVSH